MNNQRNMTDECPIWDTKAEIENLSGNQDKFVDSPRAGGKYCVTAKAEKLLEGLDDKKKARLTSWLVKQRSLGVECPRIEDTTISDEEYGPPLNRSERMERLLKHIEENGAEGTFKKQPRVISGHGPPEVANAQPDYQKVLAVSESIERAELLDLLDSMREKGWLKDPYNEYKGGEFPKSGSVLITEKGRDHLEELKKAMPNSPQVFVAMWFDKSMSEAWEKGIKPAIKNSGYEPFRIDEAKDVIKIDDRIIAEIKRSRFLVADFTHGKDGARGSVYYEAGFAQGLEIPVIFTCRTDLIDKVHFDIRQYYHIPWEKNNLEDLRRNLEDRILARTGSGPKSN